MMDGTFIIVGAPKVQGKLGDIRDLKVYDGYYFDLPMAREVCDMLNHENPTRVYKLAQVIN